MMKYAPAIIAAIVLPASTVFAGSARNAAILDVTAVQNGEGETRVLFRSSEIPFSERSLVQRATLTLPYSGASDERIIQLRVHPVTEAWQGGGDFDTEFDRELYATCRADLNRGSGSLVFDFTVIMKEILEEGMFSDGFVLTLASDERDGIEGRDASRFASIAGGELYMTTAMLPSGRAPWSEDVER